MSARRSLLVWIALAVAGVLALQGRAVTAFNGASQAQTLFALTNQDRTSNGVPALVWNSKLAGIAAAQPVPICGITVSGRAQDMVDRNYFAHQIPPCGKEVFAIETAMGIRYDFAGENVGWTAGTDTTAPTYINSAFMASPDHRANILDPRFNQIGIGVAQGTSSDTCCAGDSTVMFAVEFIQTPSGGGAATGPPPATHIPAPVASPTPTPTPTPQASPSPSPTASASPSAVPGSGQEVETSQSSGGLFEALVEQVLRRWLGL